MADYDKEFPGYDFSQNAGYGTKSHLQGLERRNSYSSQDIWTRKIHAWIGTGWGMLISKILNNNGDFWRRPRRSYSNGTRTGLWSKKLAGDSRWADWEKYVLSEK